jgi:hypothetical protein
MVPRRAHAAECAVGFAAHHQVRAEHRGAGGAQRGAQAVRVHRRIRIQVHGAFLGRRVADGAYVVDRMHARELLVARQRRVVAHQVLADARGDELVFDCGEALGTLRMVGAHVVLEAIRVRNKSRGHASRNHTASACTIEPCC